MRFEQVGGRPFTCVCLGCDKRMQTDREPVHADLDGPAFRAYCCLGCENRSESRLRRKKEIESLTNLVDSRHVGVYL